MIPPEHERAAAAAVEFLAGLDEVEAVLLVGSAARRADANDLDLSALVRSDAAAAEVERRFAGFAAKSPELRAAAATGPFRDVELHALTGEFAPGERGWTSGPDDFEVAVGNEVAYSVCLWQRGSRYDELRGRWLPYYGDDLRARRLADARMYALNDLDHVPLMLERDEPFHAFHRLYHAFQEFLQALFVARRVYPIAYDKWIREQVEALLGLPELYRELPGIVGVPGLEPAAIARSERRLRALLDAWTA